MFYSESIEEYILSAESQPQDLFNSYLYFKVIISTSGYIGLCFETVVREWSLYIMLHRL